MNNKKIDNRIKFIKITFELVFWGIVITLLILAILGITSLKDNIHFQKALSQITLWLAILNAPLTFIKIKSNLFFVFVKRKMIKVELDKEEKKKKKEKIDMLNLKEKKMLKLLKDKKIKNKVDKKHEKIEFIKNIDNIVGININDYTAALILDYVKRNKFNYIKALILAKSDIGVSDDNINNFINKIQEII